MCLPIPCIIDVAQRWTYRTTKPDSILSNDHIQIDQIRFQISFLYHKFAIVWKYFKNVFLSNELDYWS